MEENWKIIEYMTCADQPHWLAQLERCEWDAGKFLVRLLKENTLKELVGQTALVLMLTRGDELVSFCTYAPLDDVQPTELTPWVGFVYTFPEYRGYRYFGRLLEYAEGLAAVMGREAVYISTNHNGLYEKYGYSFYQLAQALDGDESRIYRKLLTKDDPQHAARLETGDRFKAEIVAAARKGTDPVACCGFSCNHCFLSQWCGGCKSAFNCCSFGTLFEKGVCPNVACTREKGLEGCYACPELDDCTRGFYAEGNDGANDCKAQAMFVRKYGKEALFTVHDRLHEKYDFGKIQEILGEDLEKGMKILEDTLHQGKN